MFLISKARESLKEAQTVFEAVNKDAGGKRARMAVIKVEAVNTGGPVLCWQLQDLVTGVRPASSLRVFWGPARKNTAFAHISLGEELAG